MHFKKIIGKSVYLSPMCLEDHEMFTKWINDETLSKGVGNYNNYISIENEKDWVERICKGKDHHYAVVRLIDNKLLGVYGLNIVSSVSQRYQIGGFIGDIEDRGKGYGSEALMLLSRYAFDILNANSLFSGIFAFNEASLKSAKKAGYRVAGTFHEAYYYNGKFWDEICIEQTKTMFLEK